MFEEDMNMFSMGAEQERLQWSCSSQAFAPATAACAFALASLMPSSTRAAFSVCQAADLFNTQGQGLGIVCMCTKKNTTEQLGRPHTILLFAPRFR